MAGWKKPLQEDVLQAAPPTPSPIQEREKDYKHNIVRTEEIGLGAIISHIEGSSWTVDYYSQMHTINGEPMPYDINQSRLNQQYHLINNLELKLQDQNTETDDESNKLGIRGTAVIYAGIIPNQGDVIVSDIGGGLAGRHTVIAVNKKMYLNDTVYEIDFELVEYLNTKDKEEHLNSFVVKNSVFNRDLLTYGSSPVLLKSDYDDLINAEDVCAELIDDFLKEFFSNELTTLEVPGYGSKKTYDPFVVEAFREVVNLDEHPLMRRLRALNINEIKEAYSFSIWPVLIDPSVNKIRNIWKKAGPVSYDRFHLNHAMNSFRYSGFSQCISPVEDLQNVDYYHGWAQVPKVGSLLTLTRMTNILTGRYGAAIGEQLAREVSNSNKACCHHLVYYHEANPSAMPIDSRTWLDTVNLWLRATGHMDQCLICGGCGECCSCVSCQPVDESKDHNYVVGADFWQTGSIDNQFYSIIRRYLNGDHIPLKEIFTLTNERQKLTPKQRFYRMMVLLIILKSTMRGL